MRTDFAIQLYSLRDITKEDYMKGLKLVSDLGFENVELAGTYGLSATEFKKVLDNFGLKTISAHVGLLGSDDDYKAQAEYLNEMKCSSVICPYSKIDTYDECKNVIERLQKANMIYKQYGIRLGYHNHQKELLKIDGEKRVIDLIAESGIMLQPDIFWVMYADNDPYELIKKYSGQIISLHFKETDAQKNNIEFGNGIIDWKKIDEYGKKAGAAYNILEQEENSMPVADSITECAKNINNLF